MQPLKTKKKSCNISGQKNAIIWDKKSYATSRDKKITKPLGTKRNYITSLDKNNCATSRDKKIMQLLGGKKITQPLETNKITQPLRTKKSQNLWDNQNHATSWNKKKITLSIGPIASKLVHRAPNCSKWHQICPNGSK